MEQILCAVEHASTLGKPTHLYNELKKNSCQYSARRNVQVQQARHQQTINYGHLSDIAELILSNFVVPVFIGNRSLVISICPNCTVKCVIMQVTKVHSFSIKMHQKFPVAGIR